MKEVFICLKRNFSFFFLHVFYFLLVGWYVRICVCVLFSFLFHSNTRPPIFSPIIYVCAYLFSFAVIFIIKIGQFMKIGLCLHSNIHENKSVVFFIQFFILLYSPQKSFLFCIIFFFFYYFSFRFVAFVRSFVFSLILVPVLFLSGVCVNECVNVWYIFYLSNFGNALNYSLLSLLNTLCAIA